MHRICRSAILVLLASCTTFAKTPDKEPAAQQSSSKSSAAHAKGAATVAEAQGFMKNAEDQLEDLNVRASRASWVQENFITDDTETMRSEERRVGKECRSRW